jgi:hypothetical protein
VQLADDFRPTAGGMEQGVERDEYCLLCVVSLHQCYMISCLAVARKADMKFDCWGGGALH